MEKRTGPGAKLRLLPEQTSPEFKAQDLIYTAWDTRNPKDAVKLARKALKIWPDCTDAYNVLAEFSDDIVDAAQLRAQGIEAAYRTLDKQFFKENTGYFWGLIETRPYMRAVQGLAEALADLGLLREACEKLAYLIKLNPYDNQGNRYSLMEFLLTLQDYAEANKLFRKYSSDDHTAQWLYSGALLSLQRNGRGRHARNAMYKAYRSNSHVWDLITGRKKMPATLSTSYQIGSLEEAALTAAHLRAPMLALEDAHGWIAHLDQEESWSRDG